MNNLDKQYTDLLQDILDNGVQKGDRTGTGTISVFGRQIRHKMSDGFPLLTTKKMPFKTIVTELLWFLRGDTNIKYLVDNNCHIWDGDAYKRYLNTYKGNFELDKEEFINAIKTSPDFAKQWGELGPIYGKQWRNWRGDPKIETDTYGAETWNHQVENKIDQISNLINDLKTNPDSRRLMVNAWNVGELDQMVLPPCHTDFQFFTRELSLDERLKLWDTKFGFANEQQKNQFNTDVHLDTHGIPKRAISLMWNQRSVDTFLGLPFNIASYGLLLEIIAKEVNMVPDELIGNLGDTHLYLNHLEQAKEQIGKELSLEERKKIYEKEYTNGIEVQNDSWLESKLKTRNIPTRTKEPYLLPTLNIKLHFNNEPSFTPEYWLTDDFELLNYQSHPTIKAPLSN
jgi:thymidylate synthase